MKREGDPADLRLLIIFLRSLRFWNQTQLAEATGLDKGAISDYEQGKTTPSEKTMKRICKAVGVPYARALRLLPVFRAERLALEEGEPRDPGGDSAADLVSRLARKAGEAAVAGATPALLEIPALARRERLSGPASPEAERRGAAAVCERLCEESERAAADRAERAVELAGLALRLAGRIPGAAVLEGYVWAFLGNARRVQGDLPGADEAFRRSASLWPEGQPAAVPLDRSRVLDLEASLRQTQGRFAEADTLLHRALAAGPAGDARSRLLVKKAAGLVMMGEHLAAIGVLEQAARSLGSESSPRLVFAVRFNLAVNLLFLGRHAEAEALLPEVRRLAVKLGNGLDLVRVRWLEARAAAGLGRREEAIGGLLEVRDAFMAGEIALDSALVSLELAALYLEDGRTADVKALAREMAPVFQAQGVHREALGALKLFCDAAEKEAATVEQARRIAAFLHRAQHQPGLRFEG